MSRGPVTRKIDLARQIGEAEQLVREGRDAVARAGRDQSLALERLARREGILATLRFCAEHEPAIREFVAQRHARAS